MQSDSNKKVIDGKTYEVFMLSATAGLTTFLRLVRICGPAIGIAIKGVGLKDLKSIGDIDLDNIDFEAIVRQVFSADEEATILDITAKLAEKTFVEGQPLQPQYEVHFQGKMGKLSRWLVFALEVNFRDFFDEYLTSLGVGPAPDQKEATPE